MYLCLTAGTWVSFSFFESFLFFLDRLLFVCLLCLRCFCFSSGSLSDSTEENWEDESWELKDESAEWEVLFLLPSSTKVRDITVFMLFHQNHSTFRDTPVKMKDAWKFKCQESFSGWHDSATTKALFDSSRYVGGNESRPARVRWADANWTPQRSPHWSPLNRRSRYTPRTNATEGGGVGIQMPASYRMSTKYDPVTIRGMHVVSHRKRKNRRE